MSKVQLDSSKQIVKKLYRPGQPMARFAKRVARDAERLAKTNNGKGWQYQRPGGDVRGGSAGTQSMHGAYARSVSADAGSSSRPRVELRATAQHARLVEYGNGAAPIRRRAAATIARSAAVKRLDAQRSEIDRVYRERRAKLDEYARSVRGPALSKVIDARRELDARHRLTLTRLARKRDEAQKMVARFNLDVPGGRAFPSSVRPMGRGKHGGIAEFKGYRTLNRAMREAVRDAQSDSRR